MNSWIVARRLRQEDTHLGEPGQWRLIPDVLDQETADARTRYYDEVLGARSIAVNLDDLEGRLFAQGAAR